MEIKILDGHDSIGGNKILITNSSRESILLDFGKNFLKYSNFFEEFVTPRVGAGIFDLWKLGLIPHFSNIYREGLVLDEIPNFKDEVLSSPPLNLLSVFLSHAHLDHVGNVPLLREDIPIITTKLTYQLLKSIQDTGQGSAFSDYCRVAPLEKVHSVQKETKIKKGKGEAFDRSFRFVDFYEFSTIGGFKFKAFPVDHSIVGAMGVYIEVDGVKIAYTGDLRFHGKNRSKSIEFFEFLKENGVDVLLTEGTRAVPFDRIDDAIKEKPKSEDDVKDASLSALKNHIGELVIADFGSRNVERLQTFLEIAKETKRKLAITFKDAYLLHLLTQEKTKIDDEIPLVTDENIVIIESKREQNKSWIKEIYELYESKVITIKDIAANPGDYIVCYSFFDMPNLLELNVNKKGAYIYSTSEAYSEEQIIDVRRLMNWLKVLNLTPYGLSELNGELVFTREYHASGHAAFSDLITQIEMVKPKVLIPLHTEHKESFQKYFSKSIYVHLEEDFKA